MKKGIISSFVVVLAMFSSAVPSAQGGPLISKLFFPWQKILKLDEKLQNLDWKVGDTANYKLNLGFLGEGTIHKKVTKDEGTAIWVVDVAKTSLGEQKIETLYRKSDGKVLKMIVDGKEQEVQEPDLEIIEQKAAEVTVPAGTFRAIYIKAKEKKNDTDIEAWINPIEIPIGGIAKSIVKQSFLTVTSELTDFHKTDAQSVGVLNDF